MGVFVRKSKGITSWTRIWGGWNRRFLTISHNNMKLAYSKAPLSKTKKTIDMEVLILKFLKIRKSVGSGENLRTPRQAFA